MIDRDRLGDSIKPMIEDTIRTSRNEALSAAAELCDAVHESGFGAEDCAKEIRKLRDRLPQPSTVKESAQ